MRSSLDGRSSSFIDCLAAGGAIALIRLSTDIIGVALASNFSTSSSERIPLSRMMMSRCVLQAGLAAGKSGEAVWPSSSVVSCPGKSRFRSALIKDVMGV